MPTMKLSFHFAHSYEKMNGQLYIVEGEGIEI